MSRHRRTAATVVLSAVLALVVVFAGCAAPQRDGRYASIGHDGSAKYVFLLVGDGMGPAQVHAAEIYRAAVRQRDAEVKTPGADPLVMSSLPVFGVATTYSANRQTTDSAASGTALATGHKTSNGMIAMTPDETRVVSVAELAKARGMKVGILTDVAANDATPSVFYAHQKSRGESHAINMQIADSCLDFLGGSSLRSQLKTSDEEPFDREAVAAAKAAGFRFVTTPEELAACRPGDKVLSVQRMPWVIDREPGAPSLADQTRRAIEILDNPNGFFMMVEAGKIDGAGHANDARTNIDEVLGFDEVIAEVLDFYRRHPAETLIVITADHETGGMTLNCDGKRSPDGIASLADQKRSCGIFAAEIFLIWKIDNAPEANRPRASARWVREALAAPRPWKGEHPWTSVEDNVPDELKALVQQTFGFAWDDLSAEQADFLERAYDSSMGGRAAGPAMYGRREAFPVAIARVVGERAGIGWTTIGHSPLTVPVRAVGVAAYRFAGMRDNTDIPRLLAEVMRLELPVD